jgi:ubiquinone/menaquinone biosynthesis C-methylase UbiE
MKTDFQKIKTYYQHFNEWNRLDTPPGRLELKIVLEIIKEHLPSNSEIFDLGGGAGRYSYELALRGYKLYLADLSPGLIEIAKEKLSNFEGKNNIKGIEIANAIDLSNKEDEIYSNVMLFGPLYHLTTIEEIDECIKEVYRVLKVGGKIIATYIPYQCGLSSILERSFAKPSQVDKKAFFRVYNEGVFNNQSESGFQEGNFIKTEKLLEILEGRGFEKILLRSIRGIGYKQEKEILEEENRNPEFYNEIMKIIHLSSEDRSIIDTCGHAVYIGRKR